MASGDLTYNENVQGVLTAPQRTALASLLNPLWDGPLLNLKNVTFWRNPDGTVGYSLHGSQTKAPSQIPIGCRVTGRVP